MQGRESEKESNIQQFRNLLQDFRKLAKCPRGTSCRTESKAVKKEFRKPCETENEFCNPLRNFRKLAKTIEENEFRNPLRNFHKLAKSSRVIFRYLRTDSVRFLSQDILCNYLFSPCN